MSFEKAIKIKGSLPGPKAQQIIDRERKVMATGTKCWDTPAVPLRGDGLWFEDVDGNVMMDWTNGMVTILGHNEPGLVQAQKEQLDKVTYFNSPDFPYEPVARLAENLIRLSPGDWDKKVFLACSGTEANEAALKVARIGKKRNLIISFIGAFHGRTAGSLSCTASKAVQRRGYTPILGQTVHLPYPNCYRCWYKMKYPECDLHCIKVLRNYFDTVAPAEDVAAIIYEPMQGEGGYVVPPPGALEELNSIAREHDVLTIADEVQVGSGKTGELFASKKLNTEPDIITMAKGIGSGAVGAATIFPAKYDFPRQGMHSNTFGGQHVSVAAMNYTMDQLEKGPWLKNVRENGAYLKESLEALKEDFSCIGDVRGLGVMLGVDLVRSQETREPATALRDLFLVEAYQRGLLMISCGKSVIRITPAYGLTKEEVDIGVGVIREALTAALSKVS